MFDSWSDLVLLLLGWLLGLLGPAIVDAIKRRRETKRVRNALKVELRELRFRLALASYFIQMRFGQIDRTYLEWVKETLATYRGNDAAQRILRSVEMQLSLSDAQISKLAEHERASPEGALSVKKYAVPLLDARVASIWELDEKLQNQLLEVRANIDLLNEEVDQARYYFTLSFEDLNDENRSRMETNLRNAYLNISTRGKIIVDKISASAL